MVRVHDDLTLVEVNGIIRGLPETGKLPDRENALTRGGYESRSAFRTLRASRGAGTGGVSGATVAKRGFASRKIGPAFALGSLGADF